MLTLAAAQRIDPADALRALTLMDFNAFASAKAATMLRGHEHFNAPTSELDMSRKDVRLMVEAVGAQHAPNLIVLPAVAARMDQLIAQGLGSKDSTVLAIHLADARMHESDV